MAAKFIQLVLRPAVQAAQERYFGKHQAVAGAPERDPFTDDENAFTEVAQQIPESTNRMAGNLKVIELQNELERLDREWEMKKELYYVSGKHGSRSRPSPVGAVVVGIIGLVFMSFWISTTSSIGAPSFFPIFGVIGICILIFNVVSNLNKAESLKRAEETYEHQRSSLLAQIDSARKH